MKKITEYVDDIAAFEDQDREFKLQLNKDNPVSWLKTIVGFGNNHEGGSMYIGVADNGDAIGISPKNFDRERRYLVEMIKGKNRSTD